MQGSRCCFHQWNSFRKALSMSLSSARLGKEIALAGHWDSHPVQPTTQEYGLTTSVRSPAANTPWWQNSTHTPHWVHISWSMRGYHSIRSRGILPNSSSTKSSPTHGQARDLATILGKTPHELGQDCFDIVLFRTSRDIVGFPEAREDQLGSLTYRHWTRSPNSLEQSIQVGETDQVTVDDQLPILRLPRTARASDDRHLSRLWPAEVSPRCSKLLSLTDDSTDWPI